MMETSVKGRREAPEAPCGGPSPRPGVRLVILAVLAIAAIGCAALVWLRFAQTRFEPPVIQGVKEQIALDEGEDLSAALLDGVSAVGGQDRPGQLFPVEVHIYDQSGEQEPGNCGPGTYRLVYLCPDEDAQPVESTLVICPADTEAPVITGAQDLFVEVGETVSYRSGITVTDNRDPSVPLQVDAGQVDLTTPGIYPVVYSAADSRGNRTELTVVITVIERDESDPLGENGFPPLAAEDVTQEQLDKLADRVLSQITSSGMSQKQKADAIFNYTHNHIRYVGTSDKSSWIKGAYIGLTQGRGDCFNYFACSKELLTRAGISNIDLYRVGGTTDHYWQLVNVGDGWYHFDACPHPNSYPIRSFLLTEAEVREYTKRCSSVRKNYYVYNYADCPVTVVGTPAEELPPESEQPPKVEVPVKPEQPPEAEVPSNTEQPPETEVPVSPEQPPEGESQGSTGQLPEGEAPANSDQPPADKAQDDRGEDGV